ncbi:uncharacterized protein N7477_007042, partial [Penicillium maclennaniae]|uniref:uncharacterized protein n=1 Tax=Penicillium maclennaniae TaxID=1343394 RepID=UPI002541F53B
LIFLSLVALIIASLPRIKRRLRAFTVRYNCYSYFSSFVCNCSDCYKLTVSVYATNFTVYNTHLKYLRGRDNLKIYS